MKKTLTTATLFLLAVLFIGYSLLWYWMADRVREDVHAFMVQAAQQNIIFTTRTVNVIGYPGLHTVFFSGRIAADGIVLDIPALAVQSRFLVGGTLTVEMKQGYTLLEPATSSELWSLDSLRVEALIPDTIPAALTHEDLTVWRESGGTLVLNAFELQKQGLQINGSGSLTLDETLQPAGALDTAMTGHMKFLRWLQGQGHVETREALLTTAVLTGLSETDAETGDSTVKVPLTLQNRTLFAGPLRLAVLPVIEWGWHSPSSR